MASVTVALVLAIPILVVAASLFLPGGQAWDHLVSTVLPAYVTTTLILCAAVLAGVVMVGVACAWIVTAWEFPGRRIFEWALLLPLAVPAYVVAYAYTDWLQYSGPVQTWLRATMGWGRGDYWFPEIRSIGGAAAMFVSVLYPYVYLIARAAFLEQSPSMSEAGRTLGLSARATFFRVNLPMARPAIAAGAALAVMETLADFGTVAYFGVQTFTTGIFRAWLSMGEPIAAAKLSVILLAFVALLVTAERAARRRARFHASTPPARRLRRPLRGRAAAVCMLVCAIPLAAGFVVPAILLVRMSVTGGDETFGPRFLRLALNSATLAVVTAALAVALALLLAYGARISRSPWAGVVNRVVGLGYAVPGAVVAIGVLIPLTRLDHLLADLAERAGVPTGLWHRGPGLRVPDPLPRRGPPNRRRRARACDAAHGGRRAFPRHGTGRHAAPRARTHPALEPGHRGLAGVRRRDEGAARHLRDAAVQLRHARGAGLQPRRRRAPRRSLDRVARDHGRGAAAGGDRFAAAGARPARSRPANLKLGSDTHF
jgi:iron(III) transport system permease protein